jgi:hypothetical protein
MNKGWGEEDYDEDLPDWMLAKNYQNGKLPTTRKSVEQIAEEILKKPPIPIILKDPTKSE